MIQLNRQNRQLHGATRLDGSTDKRQRRHLLLLGLASLGIALIALAVSTPQEAANLPADALHPSAAAPLLDEALADLEPTRSERAAEMVALEPAVIWHDETVRNGDNLSLIFARAGFSDRDVYAVTQADGGKALRKIFPGEEIAFLAADDGVLQAVKHTRSKLKATVFKRHDNTFATEILERTPELQERGVNLVIRSSLFNAGADAGLSNRVIMDLAGIFGGVIDFALDPRVGDTIELVFEEAFLDDEKLGDGAIVAAAFTNRSERFEAYRFTDSEGDTSYYNEEGVSMRKAFLQAPVDFTRVTSNFNPTRLHPIYKTRRPHRGTDYAAPRGTPVYAAGDGRVIEAGYTSANGNYVFVQHGESFKTHYLHLNKRRVTNGDRVKQGQVIGTVGSSGAATGPHLHYEFLVHGVHRNPRSVHKLLPKAKSLPESELATFKAEIQAPLQQLASLRSQATLAQNL